MTRSSSTTSKLCVYKLLEHWPADHLAHGVCLASPPRELAGQATHLAPMAAAMTCMKEWGWQAEQLHQWQRPEIQFTTAEQLDLHAPRWQVEAILHREAKQQRAQQKKLPIPGQWAGREHLTKTIRSSINMPCSGWRPFTRIHSTASMKNRQHELGTTPSSTRNGSHPTTQAAWVTGKHQWKQHRSGYTSLKSCYYPMRSSAAFIMKIPTHGKTHYSKP